MKRSRIAVIFMALSLIATGCSSGIKSGKVDLVDPRTIDDYGGFGTNPHADDDDDDPVAIQPVEHGTIESMEDLRNLVDEAYANIDMDKIDHHIDYTTELIGQTDSQRNVFSTKMGMSMVGGDIHGTVDATLEENGENMGMSSEMYIGKDGEGYVYLDGTWYHRYDLDMSSSNGNLTGLFEDFMDMSNMILGCDAASINESTYWYDVFVDPSNMSEDEVNEFTHKIMSDDSYTVKDFVGNCRVNKENGLIYECTLNVEAIEPTQAHFEINMTGSIEYEISEDVSVPDSVKSAAIEGEVGGDTGGLDDLPVFDVGDGDDYGSGPRPGDLTPAEPYDEYADDPVPHYDGKNADTSSATSGQKEAMEEVLASLSHGYYSKEQLVDFHDIYELPEDDVRWAAEHCGADWNQQALGSAMESVMYASWSKQGLKESLVEFDGFTESEAEYAINNCGADWKEEALEEVKERLEYVPDYDKESMIESLEYAGYTDEEIQYAVSQVYK